MCVFLKAGITPRLVSRVLAFFKLSRIKFYEYKNGNKRVYRVASSNTLKIHTSIGGPYIQRGRWMMTATRTQLEQPRPPSGKRVDLFEYGCHCCLLPRSTAKRPHSNLRHIQVWRLQLPCLVIRRYPRGTGQGDLLLCVAITETATAIFIFITWFG